jgi:hypothetical protein
VTTLGAYYCLDAYSPTPRSLDSSTRSYSRSRMRINIWTILRLPPYYALILHHVAFSLRKMPLSVKDLRNTFVITINDNLIFANFLLFIMHSTPRAKFRILVQPPIIDVVFFLLTCIIDCHICCTIVVKRR